MTSENKETRSIAHELSGIANSGLPFTDMLIECDSPTMIKMPGGWRAIDEANINSTEEIQTFMETIDPDWRDNILKGAINCPLDLASWRLRINAYLAFGGKKVMLSIRRIPINPPSLKTIGLPIGARLLIEAPHGIILVAGATGSGKSTTMASMVDAINEVKNAHIITIEDPIEYIFARKKAIFSQREVGVDTPNFFAGVREAMRQRPDVIVIGEIRDKDTAETALLAGESGHLVIGTLHASSSVGAIQKLLAFFPSHERESKLQSLSGSLVGVISQILLPRADKLGYELAAELLGNHKQQFSKLIGDPEKLQSSLERKEDGISTTLMESLIELVKEGKVSKLDAVRAVSGSAALYDKLKNINI